MTLQLYIQLWVDLFSIWWPALLLISIWTSLLIIDEKRGKQKKEMNREEVHRKIS